MALPPYRSKIDHVEAGEPGKASVVSRPDKQLQQSLDYLKGLVDSTLIGKALFIREVAFEPSVSVGQPVYYNDVTSRFERAFADVVVDAVAGTTKPASSAFVRGIVYSKTSDIAGDILVMGTGTVDISAAVSGTVGTGKYYLSGSTSGMLETQEPPISVFVLERYSNGEVTVLPDTNNFVKDHTHLKYELYQTYAYDSTQTGWLPATDAVFSNNAPAGAKYGYNLAQHTAVERNWPPYPLDAAEIIWDRSDGNFGNVIPSGANGLVKFTSHGIWWMTDVVGLRPWDVFDTGSSFTGSTGVATDVPSSLKLYFLRMTFGNQNSTVTKLETLKPTTLKVLNADGNAATTGDLRLDLDLGFTQTDTTETGFQVIKAFDATTQNLKRGPVAEGIIAGTNIAVTSTSSTTTSSGVLHQGYVTVSNTVGLTGSELAAELVRLDDVRERFTGVVMYLGFPAGQASGIDVKFKIPPADLPTSAAVKLRILCITDTAGTVPTLTLKKQNIARPASGAAIVLPSSQTSVTLNNTYTTSAAINDTFEMESDAISIAAGDTLFCRVERASDANVAEIGIIRIGAVIQ